MGETAKYRSLRGMPDILPKEAAAIRWMEREAGKVFRTFGYGEVRTPLLEETEVFTRSIGEDTDIVEKEIYSFSDRGGKNISLRPEGTASMVRAYIEHGWHNDQGPVKLFYTGAMFRGERPQKGRLRQFHQIGAEIIGGSGPYIDAELIFSLVLLLKGLKIEGFTVLVNSLGCNSDRNGYKKALAEYLAGRVSGLCDNCRRRSVTNVLRVLDCKREECREIVKGAPDIRDFLCAKCGEDYGALKSILSGMGVEFREKSDMVRGLDYYTGMIFEVIHPSLGAQDAIAAGGRYDGLVKQMGGPDVGATGYALGVERTMLLIDTESGYSARLPGALIVPVNAAAGDDAFRLAVRFWASGVPCEIDHSGRSFKGQMRKAHKDGRKFVVILGEDEIKKGKMLLKNMESGEQKELDFDAVVACLA